MKKIILFILMVSYTFQVLAQEGKQLSSKQEFAIPLQDGQKWQTNTATVKAIDNMKTLISEYIGEGLTLQFLGEALQHEYQNIFNQCDMKGKGHDYLHEYLIDVGVNIQEIQKGNRESVQPLLKHLLRFEKYFQ